MQRPTAIARLVLRPTLALACALAAACGPDPVVLEVKLLTATCGDVGLDPLDGVTELRFIVYGAGLTPMPLRVPRVTGTAEIPAFDPGTDRNLVVEGLQGDVVVSRGETGPMDLTTREGVVPVGVFLRRVDAFAPASLSDGSCSTLTTPRAGHTATLLDDGRVLVAGGYTLEGGRKTYLASTELYDPRTGRFTDGPALQVRRAQHTATMQPKSGLVIVAGGEFENDAGRAIRIAEVFDPIANAFRSVRMQVGRVRHAAAASSVAGRVVLVGGADSQGLPLKSTEVFEPKLDAFVPGPDLPAPRAGVSARTLVNGAILVAGGWDGSALIARTELLVPDRDGTYSHADPALRLNVARAFPLLASLDAYHVVAVGGFTSGDFVAPFAKAVDTAELAELETRTVSEARSSLKGRRGDATIVELPDGNALVVGGASADAGGRMIALASADVVSRADGTGEAGIGVRATAKPMRDARWQHATTLLRDGSVLVTGGLSVDTNGRTTTLRSAELFQPRYQASATSAYR